MRNTEEAEKQSRSAGADDGSSRGGGKGVWGMIEESELVKSIRSSDDPKVSRNDTDFSMRVSLTQALKNDNDVAAQCRECKTRLEELFSRRALSSSSPAQTNVHRELDPLLIRRSKALLPSLAALIQSTVDPVQMEELLALNDSLTSLLQCASPGSPTLADDLHDSSHQSPVEPRSPAHHRSGSSNSLGLENGAAHGLLLPLVNVDSVAARESDSDDHEPFSPRVDKGKGRATEEASPVLQKLIMSPTFSITDSDEDEEEQRRVAEEELDESGNPIALPSPTDRYVITQICLPRQ